VNDRTVLEDLIESSARGCPVCQRSAEAAMHFIAVFAREGVNDPGIRDELRRSLGFCREHAMGAAAQVGAPLAMSIVGADLCDEVVRRIDAHRAITSGGPCPACDIAATRERHDVQVIDGRALANVCPQRPRRARRRDLPRGATVRGALSVGSLSSALRGDAAAADRQRLAYLLLRDRLGAIVRHHDYRFQADPFDDCGATWEALALFSGTGPSHRPP
jgi:hypothetical protein